MTAPYAMEYIDRDDEFVRLDADEVANIDPDAMFGWFDAVEGLAGSCPHPDCGMPDDAPSCPCDDNCDGGDDCRCGWKLARV